VRIVLSLVKRNLRIYRRDRAGVLLSLLAALMLLLIYALFLGAIQADSLKAKLPSAASEDVGYFVASWVFGGIVMITCVTTGLGALGASLAVNGSWLGPLIYFVGINIIRILTRWYGLKWGYERGTTLVTEVGGGQLKRITQIAAITGLFVMGALVSKWTHIDFPSVVSQAKQYSTGEVETKTLQNILDDLLPGIAALGLTFLSMYLLNKKINALWIILGMFVLGILGAWSGFLGIPAA